MAFKEVTTKGKIEWAKVFEENREMEGYEGAYRACDGAYTVVQVLEKGEFDKLKKAGSLKKPIEKRLMDTNEIAVKFERKHTVKKGDGTVIPQAGGAPKVVGPDGKPWNFAEQGYIGNGSVAEVTSLINTFKGKDDKMISRTSLVKIKVIELIPYIREDKEEAA